MLQVFHKYFTSGEKQDHQNAHVIVIAKLEKLQNFKNNTVFCCIQHFVKVMLAAAAEKSLSVFFADLNWKSLLNIFYKHRSWGNIKISWGVN